ncbi:hypothetical protein Pla175_23630 [Pirellulimonas nuda]|uniref:Uncharacterized protein n=1 Tax=Pirellulimonas nuda TaxID=2528009 RepID=A0A518DBY5_9BACT|nr:hypothetical protein Pla175_23630 [Pirellulimonas nuda]
MEVGGATVREVFDAIHTAEPDDVPPAYAMVPILLQGLNHKRPVRRKRRGMTHVYSAVIKRSIATRRAWPSISWLGCATGR